MAHDLRTPLTTIQGTAKAVADGLVSDDKLTQTMETIMSKTAHMNELVNRLLIFLSWKVLTISSTAKI